MKITISKEQWDEIGNATGWIKLARRTCVDDSCDLPHCKRCGCHYSIGRGGVCDDCIIQDSMNASSTRSKSRERAGLDPQADDWPLER